MEFLRKVKLIIYGCISGTCDLFEEQICFKGYGGITFE